MWEIYGQTPDNAHHGDFVPFTGHFPMYDWRPVPDGLAELRGPRILFRPNDAASVEDTTILLKHGPQSRDDGGGWLATIGAYGHTMEPATQKPEGWETVRQELLCIRYGRPTDWPEPRETFSRAKKMTKQIHRG
ncbi:MAG: hypothetical protein FJY97_11770 [candidate division Zixibacteria bacterium]|nr:hypothetical protein [candidate division Zixibacteria bacterium]